MSYDRGRRQANGNERLIGGSESDSFGPNVTDPHTFAPSFLQAVCRFRTLVSALQN